MLDPCKEREPRVIDNALIEKCIDLQYPKGEVGRLLRLEGIPMEEVEEIRFEYLYILKIDHLWVLKSLVKLSINNNFIEKIENLEMLIHLKELDLSFNKIKKIENLDKLVNLEKITFYENLIESMENMENQTKLTVFSIGKNKICDRASVSYFRKFSELTSLNMAGNPCAEAIDFRLYVAAFLPTLVYYEYKRIEDKERVNGINLFKDPLTKLEREEKEEKEKRDVIEKELRDAELHSKMFVEHLNTGKLFDMMYENDEEGTALLDIGEEVTELYEEYKQQFLEYGKQIFEVGEKHHALRQTEIDNFFKSVEKAKKDNQEESIGHMEAFLDTTISASAVEPLIEIQNFVESYESLKISETKSEIFASIKEYRLQLEHDAIAEDIYEGKVDDCRKIFDDLIHDTWKNLMRLELRLFEQVEEVNQTFEHVLGEMINNFIEEVQGVFTNVRAAEVTYSENLNDAAVRYMTALTLNPDEELPESLKDILYDRDTLNNAMAATHDIHMQTIDSREDTLVHRARDWAEILSDDLRKDEIKRNRYKLLEINHFLDIQREEFGDLTTEPAPKAKVDEYF